MRCSVLSPIQLGPSLGELERDPGEGLGLVIVVTSSPAADAWRRTERISDPTLTRVGVFTAPGAARGRLAVDASTLHEFRVGWNRIAGGRGLAHQPDEVEVDVSERSERTMMTRRGSRVTIVGLGGTSHDDGAPVSGTFGQRPGAHMPPIGRDLTATLALALYSFTVGVGFARVFSGWDFLPDVALLVIVGHGTSFVLRRLRVCGWISIPVVTAFLLWMLRHVPVLVDGVVVGALARHLATVPHRRRRSCAISSRPRSHP